MLSTLTDKVRPAHCALLLVDVQNDFCAEGGAMHREGRDLSLVQAMIPRLSSLVDAARAAGVKCIWIRNVYNTGPNWYLSEVWLEQARRRRNGAYVQFPVCEPGEVEWRFLPAPATSRRGDRDQASLRRVRRNRPRSRPALTGNSERSS